MRSAALRTRRRTIEETVKPTRARLLFLAALLVSACLPLGAHVPVSEKPHLGLNARDTPLHQGNAFANSLNATGLDGSLCQHRVRSRCSASNPQSWNSYGYSINNPLRYVDPDGKDFLDAVEGFANAVGSNAVGGIGRVEVGSRPSEAGDFRLGQALGDVASVVVGTIEVLAGFGTGTGGVAACGTAVGCAVAPAAVVEASALVVQGGTMAVAGAGNLVAAIDNNPSDGGSSEDTPATAEKPDLGRPGTQRNPDGTRKTAQDQDAQLKEAKKKRRAFVETTKRGKSEKAAQNELKRIDDLEDADELFP